MNAHIQEFLDYLTAERGSSDNTVSAYRNDLTQLDELMTGRNKTDWSDVTRDDLIEYILWLKEREYASATVARKVAAMKSFFGFLLRTGKIEDNPAEDLDSPKVKKQLPQTLTPEEVDRLLALPAQAGDTPKALRDTALLEMLYATGMRVSETASVTLDDLDLQAGTVRCLGKGSKERFAPPAAKPGVVSSHDIVPAYVAHVRKVAKLTRPVRIAVDFANSMGILEAKCLEGVVEMTRMYDTLDGTFPNHEANPLNTETLEALEKTVREGKYDFGVAFDGDADRAGFVDEKGTIVPMDIITALIASSILEQEKGVIFYDLRSSWAVKETIEASGGTPMMSRVGHAFIKQQMRDNKAIFAGELSGHYYFRDNFTTESSAMAVLYIANVITKTGKTLSELVKPIQRYFASGEINSEVHSPKAVLDAILKKYNNGKILELDGITVEYADWWFNVRCSNTEPLVRLNLEAKTKAVMESRRDELLKLIRGT